MSAILSRPQCAKKRKLSESTVIQAVRHVGQQYHPYVPKHAQNKANIGLVIEHDMMSQLFHNASSLSYRL